MVYNFTTTRGIGPHKTVIFSLNTTRYITNATFDDSPVQYART